MRHLIRPFFALAALSVISAFVGCSGEGPPSAATGGATAGGTGNTSTAGTPASAGLATGGVSGAIASGGAPKSGGTPSTGGTSSGAGAASGGASAASGGVLAVGGANGGVTGGSRSGGGAGGSLGGGSGIAGQGGSSQGGATMSGGAVAVSFLEVENIIGNNCASCHIDQRPDLTTTGTALHSTLLSTVVKQCGNHKLVVPNDPTNSAVIELVTNECNGFFMPTSCSDPVCLVPNEFEKLTTWISLGAKAP
jgi:hypothetical protein